MYICICIQWHAKCYDDDHVSGRPQVSQARVSYINPDMLTNPSPLLPQLVLLVLGLGDFEEEILTGCKEY